MSRIQPMDFQVHHINGLVDRFRELRLGYEALGPEPNLKELDKLRQQGACVMLQAPTGIGKTLMASEVMSEFSPEDKILWLWFAPFAGLLTQARAALKRQAPSLALLGVEADRRVERLTPGAVFVLSWQTVAARTKDSRIARQDGDAGMALDELIVEARATGYRIGVVVDEAHHAFVRATEAGRFFGQILKPDYVLMMTATPRDTDAELFATQTGYRLGGPEEWASIPRTEGVDAQLLKKSVKAARFIAQNADDAQLIAFEEVALSECAAMHRLIKSTLSGAGIGLAPLMLVQVPNGGEALEKARKYLVDVLKFSESSVKTHTSDEPDPNLAALADDPAVEVIIFKMAIATGFDAPRAFTLAALRGTRDANFGIQVVGRIMRVHRLLQGCIDNVPPLLHYGYVFLANSAAQEGLLNAAAQINQMPDQLVGAMPSTVVTIVQGEPTVQVVKPGESLSLLPDESSRDTPTAAVELASTDAAPAPAPALVRQPSQQSFFQVLATPQGPVGNLIRGLAGTSVLTHAFELDAVPVLHAYSLRAGAPQSLQTEYMPAVPDDFEARLVSHIDFARVLNDRFKVRQRVVERTTDLFAASDEPEDKDVWAQVSVAAIADRARQIAFAFADVDRRELLKELKTRFSDTLVNQGFEAPGDPEELTRQLELVLVRNDKLIRDAHKRLRAEQVTAATVHLPLGLESERPLTPAKRNLYGVFPDDMSKQEREFAELLDTSVNVIWWHRNPVRKPSSVALYRWADGVGFFPDFVVKVKDRTEGDGIALSELKGHQLQQFDRAKAGARHVTYGRVFMVGRPGAEGPFRLWRLTAEEHLVDDGPFEVPRMKHS